MTSRKNATSPRALKPNSLNRLDIITPDDWHLHLRDGEMLKRVAPLSAHFARALIMPNLVPPITSAKMALEYRERIIKAGFANPLMTLYLAEETSLADIEDAHASPHILAVKLYPAGATTNSASGVRDFDKIMPVLEHMARLEVPLCVHGEVVDTDIDIFDREAVFIERVLDPIRSRIPELRVVLEHITTDIACQYVLDAPENGNLAASITIHHLLLERNDMLAGGMRPHYYCLPILKRSKHRAALRRVACSGDARFFLGTDSAPHSVDKKECECCAAGVFSAPVALPWLAQIFEEEGALDQLEKFTSINGAKFYALKPNETRISLTRSDEAVTHDALTGAPGVRVFDPGRALYWRIVE